MSWEQLWMDSILKWSKRTKVSRSFKLRIIRKRSILFRSQTLMSRFARGSKDCDFSCVAKNRKFDDFSCYLRFLAVLCHVNNHWCPRASCRFNKICENCERSSLTIFCVTYDFSQFFVVLIITKPKRVADLTKFAKIAKNRKFDDFSGYLRFLEVLCHVNQFTFLVFMIT